MDWHEGCVKNGATVNVSCSKGPTVTILLMAIYLSQGVQIKIMTNELIVTRSQLKIIDLQTFGHYFSNLFLMYFVCLFLFS